MVVINLYKNSWSVKLSNYIQIHMKENKRIPVWKESHQKEAVVVFVCKIQVTFIYTFL